MKEVFREIAGYEGLYEVSNLGNVRRVAGKGCKEIRVLKLVKQSNGYLYVNLYKEGNRKMHRVHRLVAQAFLPNPNNLPEVNHIDEDKTNNKVCSGMVNLEWCDRKYNNNYGTGHQRSVETQSKKPIQLTLDYVLVKEWESVMECGRNGFCISCISECCNNKYCSQGNVYKGYRWMFAEDYYKMFA